MSWLRFLHLILAFLLVLVVFLVLLVVLQGGGRDRCLCGDDVEGTFAGGAFVDLGIGVSPVTLLADLDPWLRIPRRAPS